MGQRRIVAAHVWFDLVNCTTDVLRVTAVDVRTCRERLPGLRINPDPAKTINAVEKIKSPRLTPPALQVSGGGVQMTTEGLATLTFRAWHSFCFFILRHQLTIRQQEIAYGPRHHHHSRSSTSRRHRGAPLELPGEARIRPADATTETARIARRCDSMGRIQLLEQLGSLMRAQCSPRLPDLWTLSLTPLHLA